MRYWKFLLIAALFAVVLPMTVGASDVYLDGMVLVEQDIGPPELVAELTSEQNLLATSANMRSNGLVLRAWETFPGTESPRWLRTDVMNTTVRPGLLMRIHELKATARNGVQAG